MASDDTIGQLLDAIAGNYGRGVEWRSRVEPAWVMAFRTIDDALLVSVCKHIMEQEEHLPPIAVVKSYVAQAMNRTPVSMRSGQCRLCGSGWRTVAVHRDDHEGRRYVETYAAKCDCNAGRALGNPRTLSPGELVKWAHTLPRVVAVYLDPRPRQLAPMPVVIEGGKAEDYARSMVGQQPDDRPRVRVVNNEWRAEDEDDGEPRW